MTRRQRLFIYIAAGAATGLAIAFIVLFTMSRTEFGMERVRRFAVGWLADRVDGEVHIGSIGGRGLLGGVTLHDFSIIDKRGRPFMRMDSAILSYNWRTLLAGKIVIDDAKLFNPEIYFEQLPGDTIWNFQHVFPDRSKPGAVEGPRRLILLNDTRIMNGVAVVRVPFESAADTAERTRREVIEDVPGGVAKVMRFDSLYGELPRVVWESPIEEGRLFDVRSLRGRGFVWSEPLHVADMRGTVTLRDTIVAFDMPDVRMPASRAAVVGRVVMEEGLNFFDVKVDTKKFSFADLQWLYPKLPNEGGGSGVLRIQSQRPRGILWLATDAHLVAPGTRLAGSFGIVTGADSLYFTNVDLRASPLNLELIQNMVPKRLPLDGLLVGTVEVKGSLSALDTKGDVQLANAAGRSGVTWKGRLDLSNGIAARNFTASADRLDLALLNVLQPELKLSGRVSGRVQASGSIDRSVKFAADIHHYLAGSTSSFAGAGTYTGGAAPGLEIELNALPLSLSELSQRYPALARLQGEARGPIHLSGPLDDLTVTADLETDGGRAKIDGRLTRNAATPRYRGTATLFSFRLDQLVAQLPETDLDGNIVFDVSGTGLDEAGGRIDARFARGTVRGVDFSDAHAAMTLEAGLAHVDTLKAHTLLGDVSGSGTFGLTAAQSGRVAFTVRSDSATGQVRGSGSVTGSIHSFDLDSNIDVARLNIGALRGDRLLARITGTRLATDSAQLAIVGRADSLVAFGEKADTARFSLAYAHGNGDVAVSAGSASGEEYVADARLAVRDAGLLFSLRELKLGQRSAPWKLAAPAAITTDAHGLTVDAVEVRRENGGRVRATGRIARSADAAGDTAQQSDFRLDFERVPFAEFALVTAGTENVAGMLEGHVHITGSAAAPVMEAAATVDRFAFGGAALDHLIGSFTYANKAVNARVEAESNGRRVLFADGLIPLDLAFTPVAERKLADPLRFTLEADSLPATFLTAFIDGFSDVRGRVDGTLLAAGTTAKPQLGGSLALAGGSASWDVTGVRYRDVTGTMRLQGDRIARVDASLKANGGSARVAGTIGLQRPADPRFDLSLQAENFLAAKRRDAEFTASGTVQLTGRYRQPQITGSIAVDHGALYLDELYRRYQIVELDNPLLYDVVDTALVSLPTILKTQSPFVRNLIVSNLRVDVGREAWLRSRDLNVEVTGDLAIAFLMQDTLLSGQRTADDLRLTGTLRAGRGTYQLAGPGISRRFTIQEGTIEFPGTPGVDPGLAFNAVYRARSARREPIDIIAVVGGTLRNPNIRLTSDEEPPISESDLASYLFFGVPTYELTASQTQAVNQATAGFSPEVLGFAASSGFGYLANSLQTFAQNYGLLDYVSLTAAEAAPGVRSQSAIASLFAGTRLELGRYIGRNGDVYIAYSQPLTTSGYRSPGVRLEWQLTPDVTGELFVEDRFARTPDFGIQNLAQKRVYGLFLYREWSY